MQPYRQMVLSSGTPRTCFDPPRTPPCEDAPPPRGRKPGVLVVTILAIAVSPIAWVAAARSAHAGQIQIAPEALTRLRAAKRSASPPPRPPRQPAAKPPEPRAVTGWLAGDEHDPSKLAARALHMQALGVDMTVENVELARSTIDCFDTFGYWPAVALPAGSPGNRTAALDLADLPSDSPISAAGLQKHDLLLSIDGYGVDGWERHDIDRIRARGSVALEIDRNGRRLLLDIRWRTQRNTKWS